MTDPHQILFAHIRRFVPLTNSDEQRVADLVEFRTVKNKEHLLQEGELCNDLFFIIKGVLRKYVNTEKGDKQIIQFCIENWWMTDYTSYETTKPSVCNIQAVEDCELIVLSKPNADLIFNEIPMVERYFRKILQRAYEASLTRLHFIFSFSGEERYHRFITSFPDFAQRIPQYMLASYLGFTPEFLSKIRGRKS